MNLQYKDKKQTYLISTSVYYTIGEMQETLASCYIDFLDIDEEECIVQALNSQEINCQDFDMYLADYNHWVLFYQSGYAYDISNNYLTVYRYVDDMPNMRYYSADLMLWPLDADKLTIVSSEYSIQCGQSDSTDYIESALQDCVLQAQKAFECGGWVLSNSLFCVTEISEQAYMDYTQYT